MGMWSDRIGGGNSLRQSMSNRLRGTNYSGGVDQNTVSTPRQAMIAGQPHELAYITPDESDVLMRMGGAGVPVGPEQIRAYFDYGGDTDNNSFSGTGATDGPNSGLSGDGLGTPEGEAPYEPDKKDEEDDDEDEEEEEGGLTSEDILQMAKDAGLTQSNEDIQAMIDDPSGFLSGKGMTLANLISMNDPDAKGTNLDPTNPNYELGDTPYYDPAIVSDIDTVADTGKGTVTLYDASTVSDLMGGPSTTVDAATGEVTDDMLVDPDEVEIDTDAIGRGEGVLGEALNDFATQNISDIIDTTTVSGKLLAQKLGEGNYTDAKATVLGQMKIISAEFKDSNGAPRIPEWAQGLARQVSRQMSFGGVTGTAYLETMSNALMQATLGVAEKDAAFFQTVSLKNLDNRQQATINKANVLAQFEVANLDARQAALVNNAKAFLQMDLTNLTNRQQAEVINTQSMVQALFTDQAAINSQRLFTAETNNDFEKFYDQLSVNVAQFNATQTNSMAQFNAGSKNTAMQFNSEMENQRQQFYANMQYNIDVANAKWRQTVETENNKMKFEAASTDVKNMLSLSVEGMNQLWDRLDSMFDSIWKSAESELTREAQIMAAEISAASRGGGGGSGIWGAIGSIGAAIISSDDRLKENIKHFSTLPSGIKMYTWEWNEEAKRIGADKTTPMGVIAQEIQKTHPEAVLKDEHGYLMVNYGKIQ